MATQYKFVEVSPVTAEALEECVNEWVGAGWTLDTIRFVSNESSRRPVMAFVQLVRTADSEVADREAPRKPPRLVPVEDP